MSHKLDLKGLKCPMPIVKLSQAVKKMQLSETIEVNADDPVFNTDVQAWCKRTGQLLKNLEILPSGECKVEIEKKS